MIKKLFGILTLSALILGSVACSSNDDNDIDREWKALNEKRFFEAQNSEEYTREWRSMSENGVVLAKRTDRFEATSAEDASIFDNNDRLRITKEGTPTFTDSVVCRYEGWYLDKEGKKVIFDSTEKTNNQKGIGFMVNKVIDGWSTALQHMHVGDAYSICIPQQLGYGASGYYNGYVKTIPEYTTLWFDMKLLKIIPVNPNEFEQK